MNDTSTELFKKLKPYCVALSFVSLKDPSASSNELRALHRVVSQINPSHVTANLGHYVFFPLKNLFKAETPENILTTLFQIIAWLIETAWFDKSDEVVCQIVLIHTTFLSRAKSEELRLAIIGSCKVLFHQSGEALNVLKIRPTLAHLFIQLLEQKELSIKVAAFKAAYALIEGLDSDAAASFLPGCVSSLSRDLVKTNQKSQVLIHGVTLLTLHISKALDGIDTFRTEAWQKATISQLHLALPPVLAKVLLIEHREVQDAAIKLCSSLLCTPLDSNIFVEFLLQTSIQAIPEEFASTIVDVLEKYVDAMTRILQGTDEQRKQNMLNVLIAALPRISESAQEILSQRIIEQVVCFVKFDSKIVSIVHEDEALPEPQVEYLDSTSRDKLAVLIALCTTAEIVPATPERFWIAQKTGQKVFEHALTQLSTSSDLAQQAILSEAHAQGIAFRRQMLHVLYPLLIYGARNHTLNELALACHYSDISEMLVANADYLINSLSLAVNTLDMTPRTFILLGVIAQMSPSIVELVDDVVITFFDVLDSYHGYHRLVEAIFLGLAGVVKAVKSLPPPSKFIEAFDRSGEKIDVTTKSYDIVLLIAQKSQIFLSHADANLRIHVLATIADAIPIMATCENKFLPYIHLAWPQLDRRLSDTNPFVVAGALRVMSLMNTFANSFMRGRIQDILPRIAEAIAKKWEGTGRRKITESLLDFVKTACDDAGLTATEQEKVKMLTTAITNKIPIS